MIEVQRAYEMGQKFLDKEDERIRNVVQTLGTIRKDSRMRALKIAATGMSAQQMRVEVISNNLANMNTTGYNARRAEFADLHYQQLTRAGHDQRLGRHGAADGRSAGPWRAARVGHRQPVAGIAVANRRRSGSRDRGPRISGGHAAFGRRRPIPATAALKRSADGLIVTSDGSRAWCPTS